MRKMKKFKIYLIQLFFLGLVLTGCDKSFIDLEPRDQLSMSIALTSLENLEGAVLGVYQKARFPYSDFDHSLYKIFYTDIVKPGTHIMDQRIWNQMCTLEGFDATNEGVEDIWDAYYAGLSRANIIIEKIDEVDYNRDNPEDLQRRNTVLGEAYYFRAYLHLSLIQYWDNIVIADQVFSDPEQKYELASKSDVYALIVSDLETAIDLLPEASAVTSRGRVSKGVARHVMSLAYMDLGEWTNAAAMAEEVISDPAYDFVALDQVFNELNQDNAEVIFSWQYIPGAADNEEEGRNWTACQLIPLYDRCNGVARTFEQGGRPWSRNVPNDYYFTLFEEDDLRLEAWHKRYWIYDIDTDEDPLPGCIPDSLKPDDPPVVDTVIKNIGGEDVEYYLFANIGDTVTEENVDNTAGLGMTGVYPTTTKYWEYDGLGRTLDDAPGYEQVICYRYPEAFLVAAEAYLQSGTNLARGQELLDRVRERAGQGSIELNMDNLLDEEARELGFEGRRYPMLKRQGILLERIHAHNPELDSTILPHNIRWPLPKVFVDLTGVPQNELYE
jgi:hypothetical protein